MISKSVESLLAEAVAMEEEAAKEAGTLGYMARALVQATLPHRDPGLVPVWGRRNGNFSLVIQPGMDLGKKGEAINFGIPYGSKPRLILAWITTEAVRTKERTLVLGDSLSHFMTDLGLVKMTGGKNGSITALKDQMKRLFTAKIACHYTDKDRDAGKSFQIADEYDLWWNPQNPAQGGLWQSTVSLSETFFKEVTEKPIPIDMRALKALKRSPMALDLYCWLTYRLSYVKTPTMIPWVLLQEQFGADYNREDNFKAAFLDAMKKVQMFYPEARVQPRGVGFQLLPSKIHIPR